MSQDLRDLLERMSAIESGITPVAVKSGLNPQQRSAGQLPALFRPHKITALGAKTDPQHPMQGRAVGASESSELGQAMIGKIATDAGLPAAAARTVATNWPRTHPKDAMSTSESRLAETMAEIEEDMLGKIKQDLSTYLDKLADKSSDDGRRDRDTPELDKLGKKDQADRDLVSKAKKEVEHGQVEEDPTQQELTVEPPTPATTNPTLPESRLTHTMALEDGTVMEIHGDEQQGFEIRRGGRRMKSRFPNLDHARMAVELYRARRYDKNQAQDYIEER